MEYDDSVESLVRSARNGDHTAFKILYERFHQSVFRTAYRLLGDRMLAEDVTQEVFISIHQQLKSFEFQSKFHTWCYRITVNTCYGIMRRQKRRGKYNQGMINPNSFESKKEASKATSPEEILNRKELFKLVNEKLQSLQEDLKTAFVLREFEQLNYRQIADIMNCSEGTVASRLARARSQLADYLNRFGIDSS